MLDKSSYMLLAALLLSACDPGTNPDPNPDPDPDPDPTPVPFEGHCDAPFPGSTLEEFRHPLISGATVLLGAPNHHFRDVFVAPGEPGVLTARFTYGITDKDLEDERVEVWLQRCPGWESLGVFLTTSDGFINVAIPQDLPKGDYQLRAVVLGDGTTADGMLPVWPPDVQVILTDIDGTLTTSDFELIDEFLLASDAEMFTDANLVMQTWAAKDYRIVYLTGRPQLINRYSRGWLKDHNFPLGPLKLTNNNTDVIPNEEGVQEFKTEFLVDLRDRLGVNIVNAYGNATTDIGAYAAAGIPKTNTFIIGENAGTENTIAIPSYTEHLPFLSTFPDATQP